MDKQEKHVLLTSRPDKPRAALLVAALKEEGEHAVTTGGYTAGFVAEAPGWVKVRVSEDDLPRAKEILADLKDVDEEEIDWSKVDIGEPEEE